MAYNTGNPIGSGDPRDFRDNSENLDEAINGTASTWVDRLGVTRKTFKAAENAAQEVEDSASSNIAAIEQDAADVESARDTAIISINALDDEAQQSLDAAEADWETRFVAGQDDRADRFETAQDSREAQFVQLMVSGGYTGTGTDGAVESYAADITVSTYKEIISDGGEFWRAAADTTLPYTTTGAGMPEGGAFVNVGDGVLRQELGTAAFSDILGTVSESDGTPTGAIIERGSNANGEYVKFADGTLIMTATRSVDLSIDNEQEFATPASIRSNGVAPASVGTVSTSPPGGAIDAVYTAMCVCNPFGNVWSIRIRNLTSETGRDCRFLAIGRWY